MTILPGIKKVEYCKAINLQSNIEGPIKEPLSVYGSFTQIDLVGLGGLSVSDELIKGNRIFNIKLQFEICYRKKELRNLIELLKHNDMVYKITTVDNTQYLLGSEEKPWPTFFAGQEIEDNPQGKNRVNIEILYSNTHSLLLLE